MKKIEKFDDFYKHYVKSTAIQYYNLLYAFNNDLDTILNRKTEEKQKKIHEI